MTTRNIVLMLIGLGILVGIGYYGFMNNHPPSSDVPAPSSVLLNDNGDRRVEYVKEGLYPSGQDRETFRVTTDRQFNYELQTDYPTVPEVRPLTKEEIKQLETLVAAVQRDPAPEDINRATGEEGVFGRLLIANGMVTYLVEFRHNEPPTPAIGQLVTFLMGLKTKE